MNKLIFIFVVLFISIYSLSASTNKVEAKFSSCVDGDTFKVLIDDEEYSVRMLAIDTPETVKPGSDVEEYGKEASDFTCDKITNAEELELEYDDNSDKKDKYDRILAWVFVDDALLQKELISNGYAEVAYIYGDYKYTDALYVLEDTAKSSKLGIWSNANEISSVDDNSNDDTFWEELQKLINNYIEKWLKGIVNDLENYIKELIKEVFN